ncbi:uncharacterized protein LOC123269703 [Cotesia glomerata]|uniref:uncharacterized protein LOC123269703 n=1 Tax=Cotesia glomerata TaxID=32391 RepID=UPI001D00F7FB|nr:uncharacterized protein LOC123269703 [Cotesia glomerata]
MKRSQALKRLEKLISELNDFVQPKVNIHKEIKAKATGVVNALRRFKKLDEEWQSPRRLTPRFTPEKSSQLTVEIEESMDTGGDADGESDAKDEGHTSNKSNKRKDRNSPDGIDGRLTKRKDLKPSPPKNVMKQNAEKKDATDWKDVHTRKEKRRLAKEQLPKEPPKKPRPEPKRKKPLKWIRPDALIIRPAEKAKYAEILRRIKKDVPDEQVRTTVDKINKTRSGDLLITISRKCVDKGQGLQHTIANILKEEAKVEIRDLDDTTTKEDIQAALHTVTKELCEILPETIKIRKAYRGTQTAVVTLPAAAAQKILEGSGKIRIGWVNCQIRATRKPTQCYKCWHFGHHGSQCRSKTDRSKLCIRCGQEGHKIADCAWYTKRHSRDKQANMRILQLNLNHCEAAHDLLVQTVRELELDLVIIAEPYRHLNNQPWETDSTTKAVIWSCGKLPFQSIVSNDSIGFVAASINDIRLYSCYAPPSLSIADFTDFLDRLTEDAKQYYPVAIAGDFNS